MVEIVYSAFFLIVLYLLAFPFCGIATVPFFVIRFVIKRLAGKYWSHWSVRRAFDVLIAGSLVLFFVAVNSNGAMEESVAKAAGLTGKAQSHNGGCMFDGPNSPYENVIPSAISDPLLRLATLYFFVEHFFPFVVLPSFIIGFAGFNIERQKQKRLLQLAKNV